LFAAFVVYLEVVYNSVVANKSAICLRIDTRLLGHLPNFVHEKYGIEIW